MTKNRGLKAAVLLFVALLVSMSVTVIYGVGPEPRWSTIGIQKEVTMRGRVQVMEIRAGEGTCVAEITHNKEGDARIYVAVISYTRLENLDYEPVDDDDLNDTALMEEFNRAMKRCLPLIVKGYVEV